MGEVGRRKLLFVCSRNQWRSPTAENIFRTHTQLAVRSAGTSSKARRTITAGDLGWADMVLVMEVSHRRQIRKRFPEQANEIEFVVLDIPDDYQFMDPELMDLIKAAVAEALPDLCL